MRKWLAFVLALVVLATIHEVIHALVAAMYDEYEGFHIRPLGFEVTYNTDVIERSGIQWAFISGASNLATVSMGYVLLLLGERFARSSTSFLKLGIFYLTLLFLLVDPFNCSIGPFIYGGDADGIAVGLGISRYVVQCIFFLLLLLNRELLAQKLFPTYNVQVRHPLFRPWIRSAKRT